VGGEELACAGGMGRVGAEVVVCAGEEQGRGFVRVVEGQR
jgi:hypothetical protein